MPKNKTMRITGGFLVRRRFKVPPAVDQGIVRPTPDRVREAIFSMLHFDLPGALVLDLFAGSGAHGFEAISRGAKSVRFIEKDRGVAAIIKENIESLDLLASCTVELADAKEVVAEPRRELMNIIFLDPPYSLMLDEDFFSKLANHLADDGVVVFRCFKKMQPPIDNIFSIARDRIYGGTRVFLLRKTSMSAH